MRAAIKSRNAIPENLTGQDLARYTRLVLGGVIATKFSPLASVTGVATIAATAGQKSVKFILTPTEVTQLNIVGAKDGDTYTIVVEQGATPYAVTLFANANIKYGVFNVSSVANAITIVRGYAATSGANVIIVWETLPGTVIP